MTSLALSFNDVNFTPVEQDNQVWLTASELANALGYAKSDAVGQVYERNKDEFTPSMTTTLKMSVVRKTGKVEMENRIFSLRGAHLIAMFSKTVIAKKFRKWVLDILDREVVTQQINSRQSISPEQQALLHEIVARRSSGERKIFQEMWARHNRHFKIPRYAELLAIHFPEAIHYLETMEIKAKADKKEVKLISMQPYEDKNVQLLMWYVPILAKYIKNEIYPALISIQSGYSGQLIGLTQEIVGYANSLNRQALDNGMKHLNHVGSQPVHTIQWYLEG